MNPIFPAHNDTIQGDEWWHLWQIWAPKTPVLNIMATASLWTPDMDYDNIDQLHHLTHCWYLYMCFFSHFDSIPHQWQMMACVADRNKHNQNSGGHCQNRLFVNRGHPVWSISILFTIWDTAGTHTCASSVTMIEFPTSDKWWPLWRIGTNTTKTMLGIPGTASLWIQGMLYYQYQ
jgi:hypothetical protein